MPKSDYIIENEFKLYVFKKQFFYSGELDFLEENFIEELSSWKQLEWEIFWNASGHDTVLRKWKRKYGNFMQETDVENKEECVTNAAESNSEPSENIVKQIGDDLSLTNLSETTLLVPVETTDYNKAWSDIWEKFFQEIYYEEYSIFSEIFDLYFLELNSSLKSSPVEDLDKEVEEENFVDFSIDYKELELLGLPTAFCPINSHKSKKRSSPKQSEKYFEYFSSDESSSVEEEDEDCSSLEDKMPPIKPIDDETNGDEKSLQSIPSKTIKKKKRNRKLKNVPAFLLEENGLLKYWKRRFSLFSLFDEGIRLDKESWFSVTPEKVAAAIAERLACDVLIDGFCGCGGNTIQFAKVCKKVIAIDIDSDKIEMARHNAKIYGVEDKIEFIVGDFLELCNGNSLKGDIVFASPPWGGPKYKNKKDYDIEKHLEPVGASELVNKIKTISKNIALYLPRNANVQQIIKLAGVGNQCEIQHNYLDSRLIAITALYGEDILNQKKEGTV